MTENSQLFPLLFGVFLIGTIPLLVVVATSFTKISIVLLILRNALGIQQTPPNIIIYAIAIVLSLNIMAPVVNDSLVIAQSKTWAFTTFQDIQTFMEAASVPVKGFLQNFSSQTSRELFKGTHVAANLKDSDFAVLVPAFMLDELTKSFEIGVRIYIPFIAIDFVTSAVLIAMGMQMMSPAIISTPLKIMLFAVVSGWTRLFQGLILSYSLTSGG